VALIKHKLLFGTIGWNIAETTRMIEVAKLFRDQYECHFFSYGGQFEELVEEAGFTLHRLAPREGPEKIELLWKIDRGESFKQPWSYEEVKQRILEEIKLIEQIKPVAAFLGSVLTFSLSCSLKGTLLFNIIPLALSRPYLKANLPVSPFWPKWLNRIGAWLLLNVPFLLCNVRKAALYYGLPKPSNFLQLWEGDVNIVAEARELSLLKELPEGWYFSGPLFAHLRNPIPPEVDQLLSKIDTIKIYFAMGSSANRDILLKTLAAFAGLHVAVVAPIKSHLKPGDRIPDNVLVTDWLPALEVTQRVDIAVIHGGQGTVQTTVSAGVPFVGIGMQPEQDLNIFLYQKFGNAVQLSRSKLTERKITEALQMIITDSKYRQKAKEAQVIINSVNTGDIIKSVFFDYLSRKC
jgi:UDP:flavonoid glycosyltransferase YjiC (YdhE family)